MSIGQNTFNTLRMHPDVADPLLLCMELCTKEDRCAAYTYARTHQLCLFRDDVQPIRAGPLLREVTSGVCKRLLDDSVHSGTHASVKARDPSEDEAAAAAVYSSQLHQRRGYPFAGTSENEFEWYWGSRQAVVSTLAESAYG
jgi:hypothetical protein